MNKIMNKLETSNTPTKRLSKEDIYNDIYLLVKEQVDEMLQRGGTNEFNWRNATNYTDDILNGGITYGWLVGLWNGDKDEFADFVNNSMTEHEAGEMIANYEKYQMVYNKNLRKMIKEAGLTRDVYLQRKWVIEEEIRVKAEAKYL